ncbi:MAG TPA: flagellar basal body rod protein FlgC [Chloroflexota bacterium]
MDVFQILRTAGSALTAQRLRMDVISNNLANIETTSTPEGGPYRRAAVVFEPRPATPSVTYDRPGARPPRVKNAGVQVAAIVEDARPPRRVYDPQHPQADADGFVEYPNIDLVVELTNLLGANRAYEASVNVIEAAKTMAQRALDIGRG